MVLAATMYLLHITYYLISPKGYLVSLSLEGNTYTGFCSEGTVPRSTFTDSLLHQKALQWSGLTRTTTIIENH